MSSGNYIIPGTYATLLDGNLGIARPPAVGDSVVVIGTAEDGPKYEPIPITSPDQLQDIFGRFTQGNLVRGVLEVMNVQPDTPVDVRALRVGNGANATLGIKEASGYISVGYKDAGEYPAGVTASGIADPTFSASGRLDEWIDAMTVSARYEGSRYNSVTFRMGRDTDSNSANYGKNCVLVYNQFTGKESSFSYDYYNIYNTSVDVHNVSELATAINSDSNLNPYIVASTQDLRAMYEIVASGVVGGTPYVAEYTNGEWQSMTIPNNLKEGSAITTTWNDDGTVKKTVLELHHITTSRDNDLDGKPDCVLAPLPEYGESTTVSVGPIGTTWSDNIPTAGNQVIELTNIYDIALASGVLLDTEGKSSASLPYFPINRNTSVYPGSTLSTVTKIDGQGATTGLSEYRQRVTGGIAGISTSGTETVFSFRAWLSPDYTGTIPDTRSESVYSYFGPSGPITEEEYLAAVTAGGSGLDPRYRKVLVSIGTTIRKFRVYKTIDGVTSEVRTGVTVSYSASTHEATLTFTTAPVAGTIITVDYISVAGTMTEVATMTTLDTYATTTNGFEYYFVTGNTIYFGKPHETSIELSFDYKRVHDIPGDVSLTSSEMSRIEFTNPLKQPDITRTGGARIGIQYTYRPEWITLSGSEALAGGSNGSNMTSLQLKDQLTTAYGAIENHDVDIVVPMGAHLDDTYDEYSPETGIKSIVNAGFHIQLSNALARMADSTAEVIGIIPVKMATARTSIDTNSWVDRLTVINSNDRNRAANIISSFGDKRVQVVAADCIVSATRLGINTTDYYTTGATSYAGLLAALPPQESATNKYIGNTLLGLGHKLSRKQMEALISSRYVIFDNKPGLGIVVVKDVTAGIPGTDYNQLSIYRIAKMVRDMVIDIGNGYIGKGITEQNKASLKAAINTALYNLTAGSTPALRKYNLRITSTLQDMREGIIWVDIVLYPVFTLNAIAVRIRLKNDS